MTYVLALMIAFAIYKSSEYIKQRAEEVDFQSYVRFTSSRTDQPKK